MNRHTLVRHPHLKVMIVAMLLAVLTLGQGQAWAAPSAFLTHPVGVLKAEGDPLGDHEMEEIAGKGWAGALVVVATLVAPYFVEKTLDYYGVGDWFQETVLPALDSAAKTVYDAARDAYNTVSDAIEKEMEKRGELAVNDPYTHAMIYYEEW